MVTSELSKTMQSIQKMLKDKIKLSKNKLPSINRTRGDACGQNLQKLATDPCCRAFVHYLEINLFPYVIEVGKVTHKTKWTL